MEDYEGMIIKIGLALMVCVAIPAFVVGILIMLAGQDPEEEQKQIRSEEHNV